MWLWREHGYEEVLRQLLDGKYWNTESRRHRRKTAASLWSRGMNPRLLSSTVAIASILLLGACGDGGASQSPAGTPSNSDEEGSVRASTGPAGELGEPFPVHVEPFGEQKRPEDYSLTVSALNCGVSAYDLPAIEGYSESAVKITAPSGMRFCDAVLEVRNTSKAPIGQQDFTGELATSDGTIYASDDDASNEVGAYTGRENKEYYGTNTTPALNPGKAAKTGIVWQIPVGQEPASLALVPNGGSVYASEMTTYRVAIASTRIHWDQPKGK